MPLPFIIAGAALAAAAFGGKKAYDGYQKKSEAEDIKTQAEHRADHYKEKFDVVYEASSHKLEQLGERELRIGEEFKEFHTLAQALLEKLEEKGHKDLTLDIPKHQMNKIEKFSISAIEFLGTVVGSGVAGAASGFAVYGGVMAFAAASTGTPIAALSGAAAYNATMAAIGGGSLATGGLGMAGGAVILSTAVAAPLVAIAGWAYNRHAEKALENARDMSYEVDTYVTKLKQSEGRFTEINCYIDKIYQSLVSMRETFTEYFDALKYIDKKIRSGKSLENEADNILYNINNGYMLASIMTDVIITPLFKPAINENNEAVIEEGVVQLEVDENGINVLNKSELNQVLIKSDEQYNAHFNA